jgi:hypothetical protein
VSETRSYSDSNVSIMVILRENGFLGNPFESREDVVKGLTSCEQLFHHEGPQTQARADWQCWMRLARTRRREGPLST